MDQSGKAPESRAAPERYGAWVLTAGGLLAWSLALIQVKHEVVASAWVLSGFVLVVAAAFFSRVLEVSREGVKLRPEDLFDAIDEADVESGDTADELKAKVLAEVREKVGSESAWFEHYRAVAEQAPLADPSKRATAMREAWSTWNLVATFGNWLGNGGWEVQSRETKTREPFRADLEAAREGERLVAEVRAAVRTLSERDAVAIANSAGPWPPQGRRAIVFGPTTVISEHAKDVLRKARLDAYVADPGAASVETSVRQVVTGDTP